MPLTDRGRTIMASMKKQYSQKKGEQVFYASKNKGTITGVEGQAKRGLRRMVKKVKAAKGKTWRH